MSIRTTYFFGFMTVIVLLLISIYLQIFKDFNPCPLCTLQRLSFGVLGVLFLIGIFIHKKFWARIIVNIFLIVFSLVGSLLASRQIWMQMMGHPNSECGASLQYMLEALPLSEVLEKILTEGSTECTNRGFEFLYLNMAEWALVWFILLLLLTLYLIGKEFYYQK